jgi:carbon starvation protein CstA
MFNNKKGFLGLTLGMIIALIVLVIVLFGGLGVLSYVFTITLPRLVGVFLLVGAVLLGWSSYKIRGEMQKTFLIIFLVLMTAGVLLTLFPQVLDSLKLGVASIINP